MSYRYAVDRPDYADFAAGKVLLSAPGRTAFPVRLADEVFRRCLALREPDSGSADAVLYDPCCGSGYLLTVVALLHGEHLRRVVGSDADPEATALAARNLALLTDDGLAARAERLADLHRRFGKTSHAEALESARRLRARITAVPRAREIETDVFTADATRGAEPRAHLGDGAVDLVLTDVPHGRASGWRLADEEPDPLWHLLDALLPALRPGAVVAVASDKGQRARHERYARLGALRIGKRRVLFFRPATGLAEAEARGRDPGGSARRRPH